MKWIASFNRWFNDYFWNVQNEDTPYAYEDVKEAYKAGFKQAKQEVLGVR